MHLRRERQILLLGSAEKGSAVARKPRKYCTILPLEVADGKAEETCAALDDYFLFFFGCVLGFLIPLGRSTSPVSVMRAVGPPLALMIWRVRSTVKASIIDVLLVA